MPSRLREFRLFIKANTRLIPRFFSIWMVTPNKNVALSLKRTGEKLVKLRELLLGVSIKDRKRHDLNLCLEAQLSYFTCMYLCLICEVLLQKYTTEVGRTLA